MTTAKKTLSPQILSATLVNGKTLRFRNVSVSNADFILSLRTNPEKSQYLSAVKPDVDEQRKWLKSYAITQGQAYFIIEYKC
jgi:hypothetical protein